MGGWHYETTRDPLGQTVHVAAVAPEAGRPYVGMRLMCGGLAGIVLQVNLGEMQLRLDDERPGGRPHVRDRERAGVPSGGGAGADRRRRGDLWMR